MKISLKPSACFIPLQLKSLCSALCEQQFHSFWPFPHGWGKLIRQRNHYRFKSHTRLTKVGFLFSLSPLREHLSDSPYQSTAALKVGEGLGREAWGEHLEGGELRSCQEWEGPAHNLPRHCFPGSPSALEHRIRSIYVWGRGKDPDNVMPGNCHQKRSFCYKFEFGKAWR